MLLLYTILMLFCIGNTSTSVSSYIWLTTALLVKHHFGCLLCFINDLNNDPIAVDRQTKTSKKSFEMLRKAAMALTVIV